jgi:glycosyltransferase involved in cell wall biosynthesis
VLVTVVSDLDATRLGGSPLIVPNGVTIPSDVPGLPATGPVLFVGSMTYSPNREAVRWWVDDVWPLRPPGLPPLTVVGRRADTELRDLSGHPAVALGGEIADLGPLMASAAVVAIPVISGGGTRLKVLEAMAWGRPVVTTSKGAEGLPIVSGQHARVADDPASFGSAVMHLLDDRQDAAQLARSGRLLAESAYSWTTIGPAFADAVLRHGMRQG